MKTNIRKDSKVTARTANNVVVLGVVTSVSGEEVTVLTPNNAVHVVSKSTTTKLSAVDFKVMVLESSQPKVSVATPAIKVNTTKKPNKKAAAREIYHMMQDSSRKEVIAAFVNSGLSLNGASTYFQNFKSGAWSL